MVVDHVCKMQFDAADATESLLYMGRTYFFCSQACLAEFRRHPAEYADPPEANGDV